MGPKGCGGGGGGGSSAGKLGHMQNVTMIIGGYKLKT